MILIGFEVILENMIQFYFYYLDDYLWVKLCQVRDEDSGDSLTLPGLQTLLTEEYGEAHFSASEQPLLYFQVNQTFL